MKTPFDIVLIVLLVFDTAVTIYRLLQTTRLTKEDKRIIRKTCRFYEDVGIYLSEFSSKPETIADDLRTIDKLKEKVK